MPTIKLFTTLVKTGGVLDHKNDRERALYAQFKKAVDEGMEVQMYLQVVEPGKGSLAQKAMLHKMIRELAAHTGDTFEAIKKEVKIQSGFCLDGECESFGDINTPDLSAAIQTTIEIGEQINYPLY